MQTSPSNITCRWCHTDGLQWKQIDGRWRLIYPSGQSHLCRATRDKLVKSIAKPKQEFWDMEAVRKWEARRPKKEPMPAEAMNDFKHPYWNWLDDAPKNPKIIKTRAAQQETFELIP
jgi:hypothetical protein